MIIKNILIQNNKGILKIEISDANMKKTVNENKTSRIIDSFLEELIKSKEFDNLMKGE